MFLSQILEFHNVKKCFFLIKSIRSCVYEGTANDVSLETVYTVKLI
jgi:hypothetical protein